MSGQSVHCHACRAVVRVPNARQPASGARRARVRRGASNVGSLLSVAGLAVAVAALAMQLFWPSQLPGKSLSSYDHGAGY